jgi:hypothetical protein
MIATRFLAAVEAAGQRDAETEHRRHLGASVMGKDCARAIWYGFRWASVRAFGSRMLRLFGRGHMEEARFVQILESVGATVWTRDEAGNQFRANWTDSVHTGGSVDAVAQDGVPEIPPGEPYLGEFKTHNVKSFERLVVEGLVTAHWAHYVQAQLYMHALELDWGLYLGICKNDDALHAEIIRPDPALVSRTQKKAKLLLLADKPPARISEDRTFWKCKICDHHGVCHVGKAPERNCRTCAYSSVTLDGWTCGGNFPNIGTKEQAACLAYKRGI